MTIPNDLNSKLNDALIESTETTGNTVLRVANVDGSAIAGGDATEATLSTLSGKIAPASEFFDSLVLNGTPDDQLSCGIIASALIAFDISTNTFQPVSATSDAGITYLYTKVFNDADAPLVINGDIIHDQIDAGSPIKIGGYAKATAPTAVSADGDRVNAWFDLNGRLQIGDGGGSLTVDGSVTANQNNKSTASVSSVANSGSSFTVLSSNSSAVGRSIYNDSSTNVYIKFGTTATTSDFTHKMSPGSFWEIPQPLYTGRIDAIASAATGSLRITEW